MRHALLGIVVIGNAGIYGQDATLTFTAQFEGVHVPLDSILVQNLTQGEDTVLHGQDTVLVLNIAAGLNEWSAVEGGDGVILTSFPNPFTGRTTIGFEQRDTGPIELTVTDAAGRTVSSYRSSLPPGRHLFDFTPSASGVYFASLTVQGIRSVIKLLHVGPVNTIAALSYTGGGVPAPGSPKSIGWAWAPGDALRFFGYATLSANSPLSEVQEATPTGDGQFTFSVDHGIRCINEPWVVDIDGNSYPVVSIGDQCWMAENLRTTRYRDGGVIANVTEADAWIQMTDGAWCNYENDPGNDAAYGKLYNWYAAAEPNLCPSGWHVPTDVEWQQVELFLGVPQEELDMEQMRGAAQNVGGMLKATTGWSAPNTGATNATGFAGLPGGYRNCYISNFNFVGGLFLDAAISGGWWPSTDLGGDITWNRGLGTQGAGIYRNLHYKRSGHYVRCIMD